MQPIADQQVLSTLLELLPVGVVVAHDQACERITMNPAAARILGIAPDQKSESLSRLLRSTMCAPQTSDVEVEYARPDGSVVRLCQYASPLLDESGKPAGAIAVFVDCHNEALEQRVAERTSDVQHRADQFRDLALALANAEARERKRLAQRLHDGFQQFLSAARLKAAIVRRKLDPESAGSILQVERMLEQAIDESRALTTELSPPVLYDAGLGPAVEALAKSFERQRGIRVGVEIDRRAEPQEEQVRVLLFEAVRELLTNIAEHSQAKSARIQIGLSKNNHIDITVSDDGIGLDPAAIESTKRRHKLFGLMEIRERLKYIGGGMKFESAPGEGTDVTLSIPSELRKSADAPADIAKPQAAEKRELQQARRADRCRVVVADDHAIFREGLINMLSQDPEFQIVGEAADGEEAIAVATLLKPDILICDVSMPKLSGIEVTSRLARQIPGMKIIGLSMHDGQDIARAMRAAGAVAYVTKGGSSEALLALLRAMVAGTTPTASD
jgi:signal transduction histidine kinase/ActR/RegA family two-component response regulator